MARAFTTYPLRQILNSQHALGRALRNGRASLEETQVYIGLNDATTRKQVLETNHFVTTLKEVCRSFCVPFSFDIIDGGYIHDDGEYTEETSIVLTFIDVPVETIDSIAQELCALFHQESVLITSDRVRVRSVRASLS
ncbi:MAG: hypothetical protein IJI12_02625 [Atopobiaceae bacterium]|nr:hypothetical protein [Atopobiaceae bacterium]